MSDNQNAKPDFLDSARQRLAQITADLDRAIEAAKDPERRRQVTASALDKLQNALARAQDSVANYQDRIARDKPTDGTSRED